MNPILRRLSIYGDFWLRYLNWGTRHCPWFLEPVFVFAFTVMFWFVLGKGRRAVARNLGVILPGSSPVANHCRVFRVFWNFAWTMVDVAHVRHGEECIRWEVSGTEYIDELEKRQPGAILLTAHMGNYDVAAPLFAQRIRRPIHLVRTPERVREAQAFEKGRRDQQVTGNFIIHYNEPGNMLGVTLAQAIGAGGIVAIQGDRILFDVSPMTVPFKDGVEWKVPRGPFMLAQVARTAIHPVFIIRMGWRRYRVQAEPAIEMRVQERDRERVQRDGAVRWNAVLRRLIVQHWRQWFVFEEVFTKNVEASSDGAKQDDETAADRAAASSEVDSVIPARAGRTVREVFGWSTLTGVWTFMVTVRLLMAWAVGSVGWVVVAAVAAPVAWFLAMVAIIQSSLCMAVLVQKLLRCPSRFCGVLTCGVTLAAFSGFAWGELHSGCPVGWWLGAVWFAGLGVGLLREVISRMVRG